MISLITFVYIINLVFSCPGLNFIVYFMLLFIYSVDSCSHPLRPEAESCRVANADKSFSSGRNRATPLVSEQLLLVA